jgi:hypothetical protein
MLNFSGGVVMVLSCLGTDFSCAGFDRRSALAPDFVRSHLNELRSYGHCAKRYLRMKRAAYCRKISF